MQAKFPNSKIVRARQRTLERVTGYNEPNSGIVEEIAQLRTMLLENPDSPDLKEWLAFKLYTHGDLDEAIELFEELVKLEHRTVNQKFYLGNAWYKKGLIEKAIKAWEFVVREIPYNLKGRKAAARMRKARQESMVPHKDD